MDHPMALGKSSLHVPRMGIGAMVWGQPKGMARWTPAQLAYGPSQGTAEEEEALKVSLDAGVNLIDTAEMYSSGASERRVGELVHGKDVLIATKFPHSPQSDVHPKADEPHGGCGRGRESQSRGSQQLFR